MFCKNDTYAYEKKSTVSVRMYKVRQYNIVRGHVDKTKKWFIIKQDGEYSYIPKKDLSNKKPYVIKNTPKNSFKSYMSYKVFSKGSKQYKLQQKAQTGIYGIRTINGRFCIALGSYYSHKIGQKVDLIMDNGEIIKCIVGDAKADIHTDSKNQKTISNGCISEFIVDMDRLEKSAKLSGNMSSCGHTFGRSIKKIKIYRY